MAIFQRSARVSRIFVHSQDSTARDRISLQIEPPSHSNYGKTRTDLRLADGTYLRPAFIEDILNALHGRVVSTLGSPRV